MSDLLSIVGIILLLVFAGFLAMAETAISRMSRVKALHLEQEKKKGADTLLRVVEDPAPYLNIVLLLTLLSHITATVLATALAIRHFNDAGEALAVVGMTVAIFVFAELAPKTYSVQFTDRAALFMGRPVFWLGRLLQPIGKLLLLLSNAVMVVLPGKGLPKGPFISEEEIRHLVDVAEEEEEIEEEERELIHSVFEFGDTVVREVMVPRPDMVAIRADSTVDEALAKIIEAGLSRIPIYEGDTDNIIGVLYAKDLLKRVHEGRKDVKLSSLGRAPTFVPEQKKVSELLREMQDQRVHMAIVVDEYGGTAGLVTIEDLIEEIVGEIVDEYDKEEPLVEPIDEDTIRVDAKMPIDEVNELLSIELPHEEWDTVGGLVFALTGRVPVAGEKVRYDSVEFTTERVTGRRIQKVVIAKVEPEPEPEVTA
ncbi:MAG: magnesium and cobalt exporter, family [Actinomycetota bacterium]|jgi:CBS domain containing-hemolysin-like protein|nr:magnesium and cobalt exporter, family [Actinomycetota bacterium]